MRRFEGRVAVVTGAGSGIGAVTAARLAREGAQVFFADLDGQAAIAKATDADGDCVGIQVDVGDPDSVQALHQAVRERAGKLDILINAAGTISVRPWDELTIEDWRRTMRVNLDGAFLMCKASTDLMREGGYGRVVNIASDTLYMGPARMAAYVASKGGVLTFTRALATEMGPYGITANCVCPGLTDTAGIQSGPLKEAFEVVNARQAIKGRAVPDDIVPSIAFLASEEAHWVTGQSLLANAGLVRN
jgi:NAD(P)-dependent dehydrogenase (short-subunit alcohol dehydrogenase family)